MIAWAPTLRVVIFSVATPLPFTATLPSEVAPSTNVTPVGATAWSGDVDRRARAAFWPNTVGGLELTVTVVLALVTLCGTAGDEVDGL